MAVSSPKDELIVRVATADELAIAVKWAEEEGWNPGRNDAQCFYAADPEGFFVGLLAGEPVATISAVVYDESFAFAGFYIVRPDLRLHGFGRDMRRAATRHLGSRTVGLDGVLAQEGSYKKYGFNSQYHNIRYEGVGSAEGPQAAVVPLAEVSFDELVEYDAPLFATRRAAFLRSWITQPGATAVASLRGGKLVGYGVMRPDLAWHVTRLMTNSNSCTASFTQVAGIEALRGDQSSVDKMNHAFRTRRDMFVAGLNKIKGFSCRMPKGAFYTFPNITKTGWPSKKLSEALLEEAGVACLSGTAFGAFGEGYLRFSVANSVENLNKALSWVNAWTTKNL